MAFDHGSKAKLTITDSGSVVRDISSYLNSTGIERSADAPDVTALGDDAHKYIPGLFEGSQSCEGHYDPTAYGWVDGILNAFTDVVYYPQGDGSGKPKAEYEAIVSSLNLETPVDDKASMSFELQLNGKPTWGVVAP